MLTLTIPAGEVFDNATQTFVDLPEVTLQLEHSLLSISKWEAKWKTPFMKGEGRTMEQSLDYIRCMSTKPIDPRDVARLSDAMLKKVQDYIDDPQTATTINDKGKKGKKDVLTSEVIYSMMVEAGIPFECQKWHLNRLITLLRVYSIRQNADKNKMSRKETYKQQRDLNAARRAAMHSRG